MNADIHKCSYGNLEEILVIEKALISRGFVEGDEGQSQKNIPFGKYVKVSLEHVRHHRNGEIQYRIAWVERIECVCIQDNSH